MFYPFKIHGNVKKWVHRNKDIESTLFNSHVHTDKMVMITVGGKDIQRIRRIFHYLNHVKSHHRRTECFILKYVDPLETYRKLPTQWPLNVPDIADKSRNEEGELNHVQLYGNKDKMGVEQ